MTSIFGNPAYIIYKFCDDAACPVLFIGHVVSNNTAFAFRCTSYKIQGGFQLGTL